MAVVGNLFGYIEIFYKRFRKLLALDCSSPAQFISQPNRTFSPVHIFMLTSNRWTKSVRRFMECVSYACALDINDAKWLPHSKKGPGIIHLAAITAYRKSLYLIKTAQNWSQLIKTALSMDPLFHNGTEAIISLGDAAPLKRKPWLKWKRILLTKIPHFGRMKIGRIVFPFQGGGEISTIQQRA